eukprot:CAMPEP_0173212728 /NCGR_PEP_ID=MMETSP1141-20130122/24983_1 /TAXON_ID=483371 /ORGANISM="non described non described, Strain CCMP2298" /LENGTH=79 /DNA_ID=CAMNT_0014139823 /DNA_START=467 /DNA_END=706 /DNA_ORIENTATION=+
MSLSTSEVVGAEKWAERVSRSGTPMSSRPPTASTLRHSARAPSTSLRHMVSVSLWVGTGDTGGVDMDRGNVGHRVGGRL